MLYEELAGTIRVFLHAGMRILLSLGGYELYSNGVRIVQNTSTYGNTTYKNESPYDVVSYNTGNTNCLVYFSNIHDEEFKVLKLTDGEVGWTSVSQEDSSLSNCYQLLMLADGTREYIDIAYNLPGQTQTTYFMDTHDDNTQAYGLAINILY